MSVVRFIVGDRRRCAVSAALNPSYCHPLDCALLAQELSVHDCSCYDVPSLYCVVRHQLSCLKPFCKEGSLGRCPHQMDICLKVPFVAPFECFNEVVVPTKGTRRRESNNFDRIMYCAYFL